MVDDDGPMLQCGIMLLPRHLVERSGLWDERLILYNDTEFFSRVILNSRELFLRPALNYFTGPVITRAFLRRIAGVFMSQLFWPLNLLNNICWQRKIHPVLDKI